MKKLIKEYDVKFVDASVEFDKEDFRQLIGNASDVDAISVEHGAETGSLKAVTADELKELIQKNEESGNFELNLVGLAKFVKVEGADSIFLTDKGDVYEVSNKEVPTDVVPRPTSHIKNKRI